MTEQAESSRLSPYREAISRLPPGDLDRATLLDGRFRIYSGIGVDVHYAPFDYVNGDARIALVGITPGWQQMRLAFETARDLVQAGSSDEEALRAVKQQASFAGMRDRLAAWLDGIGVVAALGLGSAAELFAARSDLLHTTSAIRYPVICADGRNWSGSKPQVVEPVFRRFIRRALGPELDEMDGALIVPLGVAVERALRGLVDEGALLENRCLFGFPHPSGLNARGPSRYEAERPRLTALVREWARPVAQAA